MPAEGANRAAALALLLCAGLACARTSLPARHAADAGVVLPEVSPDVRTPPASDALPDTSTAPRQDSDWVPRCRERMATAGLGVNGTVWDLAIGDDATVYLGGDFDWAGPLAGGGVPFVPPDALPAASFARVSGAIFAVAPDGRGGWFIGGWFDRVGSLPRKNLAHIDANGEGDAAFQADADDKVSAIAVLGDRVFVGGQFTRLGDAARSGLGMLDFKGAVAAWNPSVVDATGTGYPSASVQALLAWNGRLYVGGDFTHLAGAERANLAVFEADGTLGAWNPSVKRSTSSSVRIPVRAIASHGSTLWVGGDFDEVSGFAHRAIAAFDSSGALRPWNPRFDEQDVVAALAAGDDVLYVGGEISSSVAAGQRRSHSGLAAFDGDGAPLAWNPAITVSRYDYERVMALALVGDTLFVGGSFTSVGGVPRAGLAAVDLSGNVLGWDPSADGPIRAMASQGQAVYAGGETKTVCGQQRNGVAAFTNDERLLDFNPNVAGYVQSLFLRDKTLLVGGGFSSIGGQDRRLLGEVTLSDGRPTALRATFENGGSIAAIQPFGDAIFISGGFTSVNQKSVNNIAALASDGSLLTWSSGSSGGSFAVLGGLLYVGGWTGDSGGRQGALTAFAQDRSSVGWVVPADGPVGPLLADERSGRLYAAGSFHEIAGARRPQLAAFDSSGELLPWLPAFDKEPWWIDGLAMFGEDLLVSGVVKLGDSDLRTFLLAFDSEGRPRSWNPDPNSDPRCLRVHNGTIYAGGGFNFIDGHYAAGFAKLKP